MDACRHPLLKKGTCRSSWQSPSAKCQWRFAFANLNVWVLLLFSCCLVLSLVRLGSIFISGKDREGKKYPFCVCSSDLGFIHCRHGSGVFMVDRGTQIRYGKRSWDKGTSSGLGIRLWDRNILPWEGARDLNVFYTGCTFHSALSFILEVDFYFMLGPCAFYGSLHPTHHFRFRRQSAVSR